LKYPEFEELTIILKNSVNPSQQLNPRTIKFWWDEYFKFYEVERLKKVFKFLAESGTELTLKNLLGAVEEFYGYLLHKEVEKANKIKEYGKVGKDINNLDIPCREATEYLKGEKK